MVLLMLPFDFTTWLRGYQDTDFSQPVIVGTVIFITCHAISSFISLGRQARVIWKNHSAQCIPMEYVIALFIGFTMGIAYGWVNSLFFNLLSAVIRTCAVIMLFAAVFKVKKINVWQFFLFLVSIFVTILGFIPGYIEILFSFVLIIIYVIILRVPWEMLLKASRGDINLDGQILTIFGQVAWIIYGVYMEKPFVYKSYGAFLLLSVLTTYLWFKFPKRDLEEVTKKSAISIILCNLFHNSLIFQILGDVIDITHEDNYFIERKLICKRCHRNFIEKFYFK